jgi:hypothetical protein
MSCKNFASMAMIVLDIPFDLRNKKYQQIPNPLFQ